MVMPVLLLSRSRVTVTEATAAPCGSTTVPSIEPLSAADAVAAPASTASSTTQHTPVHLFRCSMHSSCWRLWGLIAAAHGSEAPPWNGEDVLARPGPTGISCGCESLAAILGSPRCARD